MFCNKCGNRVDDGASFCANCGNQVGAVPRPFCGTPFVNVPRSNDTQQSQYRPVSYNTTQINAMNNNYSELGGWLLFFVIMSIVSMLFSLYFLIIIPGFMLSPIDWMFTLTASVLSILYAIQVVQRKTLFLRFIQIGYMVNCVSGIFSIASVGVYAITTIIGNISGFFLATLYYCKSVRVRVYMGTDEYMDKAFFSYKQPPLY